MLFERGNLILVKSQIELLEKLFLISIDYNVIQYSIESGIHYTELDDIPNRYVTLHKAASAQSLVKLTKIRCSCKTSRSTARCACRKAAVICNLKCHPHNRQCSNVN